VQAYRYKAFLHEQLLFALCSLLATKGFLAHALPPAPTPPRPVLCLSPSGQAPTPSRLSYAAAAASAAHGDASTSASTTPPPFCAVVFPRPPCIWCQGLSPDPLDYHSSASPPTQPALRSTLPPTPEESGRRAAASSVAAFADATDLSLFWSTLLPVYAAKLPSFIAVAVPPPPPHAPARGLRSPGGAGGSDDDAASTGELSSAAPTDDETDELATPVLRPNRYAEDTPLRPPPQESEAGAKAGGLDGKRTGDVEGRAGLCPVCCVLV